jgi:hypothetical protein
MSAYQTGSVKVTVNSPTVIGYNTAFSTYVKAGDLFRINETGSYPFYEVATVTSATRLSLTASYQDSGYAASTELSGLPYQIVTDFTPNYSFPELSANDTNFKNIYTKAVRLIDAEIYQLAASSIAITIASTIETTTASIVNVVASEIVSTSASIINVTASKIVANEASIIKVTASNIISSNASIVDITASNLISNNASVTSITSSTITYPGGLPITNLTVKNGIQETAVAGENLSSGNICYYKNDGKYWKASANSYTTANGIIRMAATAITANASGLFLIRGAYRNNAWNWAVTGSPVFLATPVGEMTQTAPTSTGEIVRLMGWAKSASVIEFEPSTIYLEME